MLFNIDGSLERKETLHDVILFWCLFLTLYFVARSSQRSFLLKGVQSSFVIMPHQVIYIKIFIHIYASFYVFFFILRYLQLTFDPCLCSAEWVHLIKYQYVQVQIHRVERIDQTRHWDLCLQVDSNISIPYKMRRFLLQWTVILPFHDHQTKRVFCDQYYSMSILEVVYRLETILHISH